MARTVAKILEQYDIDLNDAFAESSWAAISYWRNYVHLILVKRLGSLPRNSLNGLTDHAEKDIDSIEEP